MDCTRRLILKETLRLKPLGYLQFKVFTVEHEPFAAKMDISATSRKHPASLLLTAEAFQPNTSVRSISAPCIHVYTFFCIWWF